MSAAGIRTPPATDAYREGWERTFGAPISSTEIKPFTPEECDAFIEAKAQEIARGLVQMDEEVGRLCGGKIVRKPWPPELGILGCQIEFIPTPGPSADEDPHAR